MELPVFQGHFTIHEHSRLHKKKERYGSENKQLWTKKGLLQLGTAAECTRATAGAIRVLNAKDNIQKDTANGLREIGVDSHLTDTFISVT